MDRTRTTCSATTSPVSPENGIDVLTASSTLIQGNSIHGNNHGGLWIANVQFATNANVPVPQDTVIQGNNIGRTDLTVYRPNGGGWFINPSAQNFNAASAASVQWGLPTDIPLKADFDGDGKFDLVVYRPSDGGWYIRYSSVGYALNQWAYYQWGLATDIPLPADFDGDGRTDLVVYRPSDGGWYVRYSSLGYAMNQWGYAQWGLSTDTPLVADFDGDGRTDLVVYRPSDGGLVRPLLLARLRRESIGLRPVGPVHRQAAGGRLRR